MADKLKPKNYCWEEDFDSDRSTLTEDGVTLGHVEPYGASWLVVRGNGTIAIRPTKASAQSALIEDVQAEREGIRRWNTPDPPEGGRK